MGIGVKWPKKALECTICGPRIQNFSGGGPPHPPTRNHVFLSSYNDPCPSPSSLASRTFQTFLPKPILTPGLGMAYRIGRYIGYFSDMGSRYQLAFNRYKYRISANDKISDIGWAKISDIRYYIGKISDIGWGKISDIGCDLTDIKYRILAKCKFRISVKISRYATRTPFPPPSILSLNFPNDRCWHIVLYLKPAKTNYLSLCFRSETLVQVLLSQ